jgi:glycosyltransferase involved in cell wall biosynthesis
LTAIAGWAVAAIRRLPFVFELGDLWPRSIIAVGVLRQGGLIALLERIELFLYRRAKAVIALTQAFKDNLVERGIDPHKITVIRNGVDLARYAPMQRDTARAIAVGTSQKFVVGYIGTHGLAHDLGRILDAADLLRDEPRAVFLLVGAGAEREKLIADAERRRLSNVVFLPMQPKEAMPNIWSLCDVALIHLKNSAAFAEVIPSKMFEAMAMGLPLLLASPEGEASRILAQDGAGLWVPAGDPAALAAAVRRLMTDDEERCGLAARSLASAVHHTRERQAEQVIEALGAVLSARGSAMERVAP